MEQTTIDREMKRWTDFFGHSVHYCRNVSIMVQPPSELLLLCWRWKNQWDETTCRC